MTANPSDAAPIDDRDAMARDAVPDPAAPDVTGYLPEIDGRTAAEIAQDREESSVDPTPEEDVARTPEEDRKPALPAVPKWVVPAVAAVLVFLLLAFPFGWTVWAAVIGAIAAGAVSYAFVFKL